MPMWGEGDMSGWGNMDQFEDVKSRPTQAGLEQKCSCPKCGQDITAILPWPEVQQAFMGQAQWSPGLDRESHGLAQSADNQIVLMHTIRCACGKHIQLSEPAHVVRAMIGG